MRRIITVIGVLAALALLGGHATSALADDPGGLTCGGSVASGFAQWDGDWLIGDHHSCNSGKTYSYEVQTSTAAHPLTWTDYQGDHVRTSGACANGCDVSFQTAQIGCPVNAAHVRVKWWWQDGSIATTTSNNSGSAVCAGGVPQIG